MWKKLGVLLTLLAGSVVGGVVGSVALQPAADARAQPAPLPPPPDPADPASRGLFETIVGRFAPSVVAVDAVKPPAATAANKGKPQEESGSGVLVEFTGLSGVYVVTNNHVISGAKASEITVTLADGRI